MLCVRTNKLEVAMVMACVQPVTDLIEAYLENHVGCCGASSMCPSSSSSAMRKNDDFHMCVADLVQNLLTVITLQYSRPVTTYHM